jgi:hypothetical protein
MRREVFLGAAQTAKGNLSAIEKRRLVADGLWQ